MFFTPHVNGSNLGCVPCVVDCSYDRSLHEPCLHASSIHVLIVWPPSSFGSKTLKVRILLPRQTFTFYLLRLAMLQQLDLVDSANKHCRSSATCRRMRTTVNHHRSLRNSTVLHHFLFNHNCSFGCVRSSRGMQMGMTATILASSSEKVAMAAEKLVWNSCRGLVLTLLSLSLLRAPPAWPGLVVVPPRSNELIVSAFYSIRVILHNRDKEINSVLLGFYEKHDVWHLLLPSIPISHVVRQQNVIDREGNSSVIV
ncbi:hypothetical protein HUJ05_006439, partial [Dendroctonus ponderosae]